MTFTCPHLQHAVGRQIRLLPEATIQCGEHVNQQESNAVSPSKHRASVLVHDDYCFDSRRERDSVPGQCRSRCCVSPLPRRVVSLMVVSTCDGKLCSSRWKIQTTRSRSSGPVTLFVGMLRVRFGAMLGCRNCEDTRRLRS